MRNYQLLTIILLFIIPLIRSRNLQIQQSILSKLRIPDRPIQIPKFLPSKLQQLEENTFNLFNGKALQTKELNHRKDKQKNQTSGPKFNESQGDIAKPKVIRPPDVIKGFKDCQQLDMNCLDYEKSLSLEKINQQVITNKITDIQEKKQTNNLSTSQDYLEQIFDQIDSQDSTEPQSTQAKESDNNQEGTSQDDSNEQIEQTVKQYQSDAQKVIQNQEQSQQQNFDYFQQKAKTTA